MIYSSGCEHAIRALIRLAQQAPAGGFCLLRQMTDHDRLPEHFVSKLLQALVRADILISAKGRGGGFALRKPTAEITLRQIVEAIEGREQLERYGLGLGEGDAHARWPHHECWAPIHKQIEEMMDRTSLADLVEAMSRKLPRG